MKSLALAVALAAVLSLAACGRSAPAPKASHSAHPPAALSLVQACQMLRRDILANGGSPDKPTLRRITGEASSNGDITLAEGIQQDAYDAEQDLGTPQMFFDLTGLADDCQPSGVQIPG